MIHAADVAPASEAKAASRGSRSSFGLALQLAWLLGTAMLLGFRGASLGSSNPIDAPLAMRGMAMFLACGGLLLSARVRWPFLYLLLTVLGGLLSAAIAGTSFDPTTLSIRPALEHELALGVLGFVAAIAALAVAPGTRGASPCRNLQGDHDATRP